MRKKQDIVNSNNQINTNLIKLSKIKKLQVKLYESIVDSGNVSHEQKYSNLAEKEEELLTK